MVNFIISECSKLTQKKYKTRHDRVGKVIHWELCMRLTYDSAEKKTKQKTKQNLSKNMKPIKFFGTLI